MALFKILSNMNDTTKNLPNSYHQGYCYFDVNTGKFWIDTTDTSTGRMAINSYLADIATLANAAVYETGPNAGDPLHKINEYYGHSLSLSGNTVSLMAGDGTTSLGSITLPDSGVTDIVWDSTNNKLTKTIGGTTSDVITLATLFTSPTFTGTPTAPTAT